nr:iron-containing alcohol dehydrogenase [Candidatus Sigynarchaeota archaeon]
PFITIPTGTKAKLIAIPTTSGTGAETTSAVVLTDDITGSGLKLELLSKYAIPTLAIVDPIFVDKMPKKLVSSTAFDAIAHCMEGISGKWTNIYTEGLATLAMRLIFDNVEKSYHDADPDAREAMHNAATIAGLSFGNAQAHFGHSIGHALGAVWHVPHGFAVGMVLPYLMKFLINNDAGSVKAFASLARATGKADWTEKDAVAAGKLLVAIKDLQGKVGFPTKLMDVGITQDMVNKGLARFKELILQSGAITICPVNVDQETGAKIVSYMVSGKDVDF